MTWFRRVRDSFWFLPAILCIAALVIAQLMVWLDRRVDRAAFGMLEFLLFQVGASGGRDILGAIGGSMLAVAATSFSVTIMVLATASATYGPRLVRNFMTDRRNQFVLGIFGATFLYSLMVLRTIRSVDSPDGGFVPDISVNLAVLFAIVDVAVLVYFIHHIADSIQVATLSHRVRIELVSVVDRMRPANIPQGSIDNPQLPTGRAGTVVAADTGFVQHHGQAELVALAARKDAVIELLVMPGSHLIPGESVAKIWPREKAEGLSAKVREQVVLGGGRTPEQDIGYAAQQLTEMAVRALSPSMNDPFTAHNALQEIAAGIVPFCERPAPGRGRADEDGKLRLAMPQLTSIALVDYVFGSMRTYALGHPSVLLATLDLAERIGRRDIGGETETALLNQIDLLTSAFAVTDPRPYDLDQVLHHAHEVRGRIRTARLNDQGA